MAVHFEIFTKSGKEVLNCFKQPVAPESRHAVEAFRRAGYIVKTVESDED